MIKAMENGRLEWSSDARKAIVDMNLGDPEHVPDYSLTKIEVTFWGPWKSEEDGSGNDGGMGISWFTKSAGCGRCDFYLQGGVLRCMNESMGKRFIASLLNKMLQDTQLDQCKTGDISDDSLSPAECRHRILYKVDARNFGLAVYDATRCTFIGIRTNYLVPDDEYLFEEDHYILDGGTCYPKKDLVVAAPAKATLDTGCQLLFTWLKNQERRIADDLKPLSEPDGV